MIYKNWNTESQTGGIHFIAGFFFCYEGTCVVCVFAYIKHMLAWLQHHLVVRHLTSHVPLLHLPH